MTTNPFISLFHDHEQRKLAVWRKGRIRLGHDPAVWREDDYGRVIRYNDYGNRESAYGWEFDHIVPIDSGGSDDISNLRPLHWRSNVERNGGGLLGLGSSLLR